MNAKAVGLGTVAYTVITFPIAVIWYVLIFKEQYQNFGYFDGEPSFIIGLLTILIQGFILSVLYAHTKFEGTHIFRALKYSALIGVFFWTSHVLAFVAKQALSGVFLFMVMETIYLLIQFGIYGILIGIIYEKTATHAV